VNASVVDVWIMAATGVAGYLLRKLGFELAPVVLGLVLGPMLEMSVRQSLSLSNGSYAIFLQRPIAVTLLAVAGALILVPLVWRRGGGVR
jgi:putative tricarboxylic transport membrane protein